MRLSTRCRLSRVMGALLLILISTIPPDTAFGQPPFVPPDRTPPKQTSAAAAAPNLQASQEEKTPTLEEIQASAAAQKERERQKQIAIALFVLVGLALAWMVGFAVLWGIRTRRIVRQPLPAAPRGDELWFLKKPLTPPVTPPSDSAGEYQPPALPGGPGAPLTPPAQPSGDDAR